MATRYCTSLTECSSREERCYPARFKRPFETKQAEKASCVLRVSDRISDPSLLPNTLKCLPLICLPILEAIYMMSMVCSTTLYWCYTYKTQRDKRLRQIR